MKYIGLILIAVCILCLAGCNPETNKEATESEPIVIQSRVEDEGSPSSSAQAQEETATAVSSEQVSDTATVVTGADDGEVVVASNRGNSSTASKNNSSTTSKTEEQNTTSSNASNNASDTASSTVTDTTDPLDNQSNFINVKINK